MNSPSVMTLRAGPGARRHIEAEGLAPADIACVPAAAGGPKGLALVPLDKLLHREWLQRAPAVEFIGASIGAWRMACACRADADAALAELGEDYVAQRYDHAPGKAPTAAHVTQVFGDTLSRRVGAHAAEVLAHPTRRLHVFTSRGRHLLHRQGRLRMPLGYAGAFLTNTVSRKAMGGWLERVVFSDAREPLPLPLHDYRTHQVALDARNLCPGILASCSIPFWLDAVHDVPGAPPGAYWDGGITDYHLHLDYGAMHDGLVLYPHFQKTVIPGWLDKVLRHRHRATAHLDRVVLLSPRPEWIATLPNAKLPDRNDFKAYGDDLALRIAAWSRALRESQRLADEFGELVTSGRPVTAEPLA